MMPGLPCTAEHTVVCVSACDAGGEVLLLRLPVRGSKSVRQSTPEYDMENFASLSSNVKPSPCTSSEMHNFMVRYGMYGKCRSIEHYYHEFSNALNTLVSGEKPGFQAVFKGLIVLLCAEVVRQGVPDHGAVHSECSASSSG